MKEYTSGSINEGKNVAQKEIKETERKNRKNGGQVGGAIASKGKSCPTNVSNKLCGTGEGRIR